MVIGYIYYVGEEFDHSQEKYGYYSRYGAKLGLLATLLPRVYSTCF